MGFIRGVPIKKISQEIGKKLVEHLSKKLVSPLGSKSVTHLGVAGEGSGVDRLGAAGEGCGVDRLGGVAQTAASAGNQCGKLVTAFLRLALRNKWCRVQGSLQP